ncbi:Diphthine--ammonia ligase, partial [Armadillidium nasatum]
MKVAALISGGKDSCYNLMQCIAAGHTIEALANLCPRDVDELDSYMYQSVGHQGLSLYSEALGLPLYQREIEGTSLNTRSIYYTPTDGDERLNLVCLAYMWRRDQSELLQEIIDTGIEAVLVKVAAIGLVPKKHLGKSVREMQPYLHNLNKKYDINVCGEGGEYETFTLDCPLFKKRITIEDSEIIETPGDVGYLKFKSLKLVEKEKDESGSVEKESLSHIKMEDHLKDILELEGNPQIKIGHEFLSSEEVLENENEITPVEKSHSLGNECSWASSEASSVKEALSNIASHLKSSGRSLQDIVSITMLVKDMKNYSHYNKEYNQFFDINPPTRTCVQIGDLIFIAGMIGMIPMSLQIVNESVETQARLAYRHIGRILPVISAKATIKSVVQ